MTAQPDTPEPDDGNDFDMDGEYPLMTKGEARRARVAWRREAVLLHRLTQIEALLPTVSIFEFATLTDEKRALEKERDELYESGRIPAGDALSFFNPSRRFYPKY